MSMFRSAFGAGLVTVVAGLAAPPSAYG